MSAVDNSQGEQETISFEQDIRPLFRERDRNSMSSTFDLWAYDDVADWSDAILTRLRNGSMPCDGEWPKEQVARFEDGSPPGNVPRCRAAGTQRPRPCFDRCDRAARHSALKRAGRLARQLRENGGPHGLKR